jgi:threonine/homoserine/homoserine lactone efflux protein
MIDLLPLATYCFVMSCTPGPNNLMLATSAANFGYRASVPQLFGCQFGVAVHTFIACLGLGSVFVMFPDLYNILHILGALYLIYLAYKLSRISMSKSRTDPPWSFTQAALFQAVNPKSWMKAITLATLFMPSDLNVMIGALLLTLVGLVIGLPTMSIWAAFGMIIRRFLSKPLYLYAFNFMMGAALIALALHFLHQAGYLAYSSIAISMR